MTKQEERKILADAEYNSYDAGNFPGSEAWMQNQVAARALSKFDAEHPEVIAEIKAAQKSKADAKFAALSDFVKGGC